MWLAALVGIVAIKAAFDRGDLDETARQGALAGPVVVEQALSSPDRATVLAAIAAAPAVEDRVELLPALARVAGGPDRRTAIPAARAAVAIASRAEPADDLVLADYRADWLALANRHDRWIDVRVASLEVLHALDVDLASMSEDPDPIVRAAVKSLAPP